MAVVALVIAVAIGFVVFERVGTKALEHRAQHRLTQRFARQLAGVAASTNGNATALLSVPRLGMSDTAVAEGATLRTLHEGPAHDPSSQLPGEQGVVVILGHRSSYGAPFGRLASLRVGDIVSLRTSTGLFAYRVSRNPQELYPRQGALLTLPSPAEVQTNGGDPLHAGAALVLVTSVGGRSSPLLVVVAALDRSGAGTAPRPASGAVSSVLRSVPGERVGIVWAVLWIVVLGACAGVAQRLRTKLPAIAVYPLAALAALVATYQLYLAIDRLMPGTS